MVEWTVNYTIHLFHNAHDIKIWLQATLGRFLHFISSFTSIPSLLLFCSLLTDWFFLWFSWKQNKSEQNYVKEAIFVLLEFLASFALDVSLVYRTSKSKLMTRISRAKLFPLLCSNSKKYLHKEYWIKNLVG